MQMMHRQGSGDTQRTPGSELAGLRWVRRLEGWIGALRYRPERHYMRGRRNPTPALRMGGQA